MRNCLSGSFLLPAGHPGRCAGRGAGPGDRAAGPDLHRLGHPHQEDAESPPVIQHGRQAAEIFHLWLVKHSFCCQSNSICLGHNQGVGVDFVDLPS